MSENGLKEPEPLMISGIQHFSFCRRQWALIHVENQWIENIHTTDGMIFHQRVHDDKQFEKRGDMMISRGMRIASRKLNVTGVCDVVEFHKDPNGIHLFGYDDKWSVYPVEYKKGSPKITDADRLQLCVQAICLEEMLSCHIPEGSLYYGEPKRREKVQMTEDLRQNVEKMISEMNDLYARGHTPKPKHTKGCNACSLKEICLPRLCKLPKVSTYVRNYIGDATE